MSKKIDYKYDDNGNLIINIEKKIKKVTGEAGSPGVDGKDGIDGKSITGPRGIQGKTGLPGKNYDNSIEHTVSQNKKSISSAKKETDKRFSGIARGNKSLETDLLIVNDNLTVHIDNSEVHFDDLEQKDKVLEHLETNHTTQIIQGGGAPAHNNLQGLDGGQGAPNQKEYFHLNEEDYNTATNILQTPASLINLDYLDFDTEAPITPHKEGRIFYDSVRRGWSVYVDEPDVKGDLMEEVWVKVRNETGATILNGSVVRVIGANEGLPLVELAQADSPVTANSIIGMATHDIEDIGSNGYVTCFGAVHGLDTDGSSEGDTLYVSPDNAGEWTATRPLNPNYAIQIGQVTVSDASEGIIHINVIGQITDIQINYLNGSNIEPFTFLIDSDGVNVTGTLNSDISNNLVLILDGDLKVFETNSEDPSSAGATIDLTSEVGTDTVPNDSFVYIPNSTMELTVDSQWPSEQHVKIAELTLWSASRTETKGAFKNRNVNNHIAGVNNQGHSEHVSDWIRSQHATWQSGTALSVNGSGTGNIDFLVSSGIVKQLHNQTFPAIDTITSDIEIVNDFTTPYLSTNDPFVDITSTSYGTTIGTNKYFNLVIFGVQNKTGTTSHIMCNLPSGFYTSEESAKIDALQFSDRSIPANADGVGFLISELTFQMKVDSWDLIQNKDLRSLQPASQAGGTSVISTSSFFDSAFNISNVTDDSKVMAFDLSAIDTGNTRTIIVPDRDLDLSTPVFDSVNVIGQIDAAFLVTEFGIQTDAGVDVGTGLDVGGDAIIDGDLDVGGDLFFTTANCGINFLSTFGDRMFSPQPGTVIQEYLSASNIYCDTNDNNGDESVLYFVGEGDTFAGGNSNPLFTIQKDKEVRFYGNVKVDDNITIEAGNKIYLAYIDDTLNDAIFSATNGVIVQENLARNLIYCDTNNNNNPDSTMFEVLEGDTYAGGNANSLFKIQKDGLVTIENDLEVEGDLDLGGTIEIPTTTDTVGQIIQNGETLLHAYGTDNLFFGLGSGNFTSTGIGQNVGIGADACSNLTEGRFNMCIGADAGNHLTSADACVLIGRSAGGNIEGGDNNIAIGRNSLVDLISGIQDTAIGTNALSNTLGSESVGIGHNSGFTTTGSGNIFLGNHSGFYATGSNKLVIDNQGRTDEATELISALLYGSMSSTVADQTLTINATTSIGNATTGQDLNVFGDLEVDGIVTVGSTVLTEQNLIDLLALLP